jgi:hypothetical protein
MVIPKRSETANRQLAQHIKKTEFGVSGCGKQFPDCPKEPNNKDCKVCPFYKK